MIPKIIHYCWFGGGEMPQEYNNYIEDWKKLHPAWEIKRWDETNSPVDVTYLENALVLKNYANASNFTRLYVLLRYGGVYLDTDMQLFRNLDELLSYRCFLGFESSSEQDFVVNNAILGAESDHPFIDACFQDIKLKFNGSENADLSSPVLTTSILKEKWGLNKYGNVELRDGVQVFETEYFYPIHVHNAYQLENPQQYVTENTYSIHMWGRTWVDRKSLISIIDYLNHKTSEQEKYIALLNNTTKDLDAKANEIYFWKVHFENEFNRIQKIYQDLLLQREEENDILTKNSLKENILSVTEQIAKLENDLKLKIEDTKNVLFNENIKSAQTQTLRLKETNDVLGELAAKIKVFVSDSLNSILERTDDKQNESLRINVEQNNRVNNGLENINSLLTREGLLLEDISSKQIALTTIIKDKYEQDIHQAQSNFEKLEKDVDNLRADKKKLEQNIEEMISVHQHLLKRMEDCDLQSNRRIDLLERDIHQKENEINNLQSTLSAYEKKIKGFFLLRILFKDLLSR